MSLVVKRFIQNAAWKRFPAQEIWINKDNVFWAFSLEENDIYTITDGKWNNEKNDIEFTVQNVNSKNPDREIQYLIDEKISQGFQCFCIELRE